MRMTIRGYGARGAGERRMRAHRAGYACLVDGIPTPNPTDVLP